MSREANLLIVEDEPSVSSLLSAYLEQEGFQVTCAGTASDALKLFGQKSFDLVLLDLGLPDEDGLVVARQLRARAQTPIIFVTQRANDMDRITGLEMGGDDYVTKPFNPRELTARIRNVLRRGSGGAKVPAKNKSSFRFSGWQLDLERRELSHDEKGQANLTRAELDLLAALVQANGRYLSRDFLIDAISQNADGASSKTVDVLVSRLRRKIESDPKSPELVVTVPGYGYKLGVAVES